MAEYIALVHKEGGTAFGASFPDFPGAITPFAVLQFKVAQLFREQCQIVVFAQIIVQPLDLFPDSCRFFAPCPFEEAQVILQVFDPFAPGVK